MIPVGYYPKIWRGEGAVRFWKPLPCFRPDPKLDTLFQTRPLPCFVCVKFQNRALISRSHLNRPSQEMKNSKKAAPSKNHTKFQIRVGKLYPISVQNGQTVYNLFETINGSNNHNLGNVLTYRAFIKENRSYTPHPLSPHPVLTTVTASEERIPGAKFLTTKFIIWQLGRDFLRDCYIANEQRHSVLLCIWTKHGISQQASLTSSPFKLSVSRLTLYNFPNFDCTQMSFPFF